jgi:SAM-dependent methyltransferase
MKRETIRKHQQLMEELYGTSGDGQSIDKWADSRGANSASVLVSNERYLDPTRRAREENLWRRYIGKGSQVLDLACGTGYFIRRTSSLFNNGEVDFVGLDISRRALRMATDKSPQIPFVQGNAEELPFDDRSFDTVLVIAVMEHVISPYRVTSELARVLKDGGHLLLAIHRRFIDPFILPSFVAFWARRRNPPPPDNYSPLPLWKVRSIVKHALGANSLNLVEKVGLIYNAEWRFYLRLFKGKRLPKLFTMGRLINRLPLHYARDLEYWVYRK